MSVKIIKQFPDIKNPRFSFSEWNRQFSTHNIIINDSYSSVYYPVHWTPLSIKCAFNGVEYYVLDNKIRYAVDNSNYLILNHGRLYESYISSDTKVESFTLNFTSSFVSDVFRSISFRDEFLLDYPEIVDKTPVNFFEKLFPYNSRIQYYLCRLKELIDNNEPEAGLIEEKLGSLLEELFRSQLKTYHDSEKLEAKKKSTRLELLRRLNIARDYMYSCFSGRITLGEVAKLACLSPHHMLRKFKSHFGITPHQYLTKRRLEAAEELITTTNLSITGVCFSVGFESPSSFGVLFRKNFNFSPEAYRLSFTKKSIFK